jgi:hypothetical protein
MMQLVGDGLDVIVLSEALLVLRHWFDNQEMKSLLSDVYEV